MPVRAQRHKFNGPAFVLDEQYTFPEEVDKAPLSGQVLDRLLEAGDGAALDAEDFEELVPKGLGFGVFSGDAGPVLGKRNSVMADFIPGNGHRFVSARVARMDRTTLRKR